MSWMRTYSGARIDPNDLGSATWDVRDIARGLSRQPRFGGHTHEPYFVAQHAVLCSHMAPKECRLEALCHDDAEAYFGDIPRPLKQFLGKGIKQLDDAITEARFRQDGFIWPIPKEVWEVDNRMLVTEARQMTPYGTADWGDPLESLESYNLKIQCWKPEHAYEMYLDRYYYLLALRADGRDKVQDAYSHTS